jgi:iron complex outermembrane recepter protein
MNRILLSLGLFCLSLQLAAQQSGSIAGRLKNAQGTQLEFVGVALFQSKDSNLVKVVVTSESGDFVFEPLAAGSYFLKVSYVGAGTLVRTGLELAQGQKLMLGDLQMSENTTELKETTVTANRRLVEVKADRTVFNVEGTVNATGSNGLELLRKAPSVQVDNNNNVVVLGRAGVLIYVDGKRLPLTGQDLSNYLQNLQAAQIDRIDIITNPGAKYEAEGNAGIIDIRLKRDKGFGANGSVNSTISQGKHTQLNTQLAGNYRNKGMNLFGNVSVYDNESFNNMFFLSRQNNLVLDETALERSLNNGYDLRLGSDFYVGKKQIIGLIANLNTGSSLERSFNRISLAPQAQPSRIDSVLRANNVSNQDRKNSSFNLNYRFDNTKSRTLNFDLDYGAYLSDQLRDQPNQYFDATETKVITEVNNAFDTPSDIYIYTAKADYEDKLLGGVFGFGSKLSKVKSDNTFLFFDVPNSEKIRNDQKSNTFLYDENVYAGYLNYARPLTPQWNLSAGLRAEQTDAKGKLTTFDTTLSEPPVLLNYLSWFPSAGLTYSKNPLHVWNISYGKRINRPDYNVLNPFNNQLSQLSYERGNPFLRPEIVNNYEVGYTMFYAFNFKLAHSVTKNQITRLIGPDEIDSRSSYISWDNLAEQRTTSLNISAPFDVKKWWSVYMNLSASRINNQADYGNGATVDVQAFTYSIYQQSTFSMPKGFKLELSGYYAGPGVWGGVFLYDPSYSLDLGIQKKFLQEQLTVRLSGSDLMYQSFWSGVSQFNGLISEGNGRYDSRRVALNINYLFGNQLVKSRNRKTGIEDEAGRVKG